MRGLNLRRAARDIAAAEHLAGQYATAHPKGSQEDLHALLGLLGAVRFAVPRGHWCYVLIQSDGQPFWVGISGALTGRLGDHVKNYGLRVADIRVIKCRDEHEARVIQLMLIDRFGASLLNTLGTAQYEEFRAAAHRAARHMDSPAHVTARWDEKEDRHAQEHLAG